MLLLLLGHLACADSPGVAPASHGDLMASAVVITLDAKFATVGRPLHAHATVFDRTGAVLNGKTVHWRLVYGGEFARVDESGTLYPIAPGRVYISAYVDSIRGTVPVDVLPPGDSTPPIDSVPPIDSTAPIDSTPPVDSTEEQGGRRGPEPLRVVLNFSYPTVTGRSISVGPNGNLQSALNTAQRGDEIVLPAGATYTGNFTLPAKGGSASDGWIVIRSEQLAQLPAIGTRVTALHAPLMPRIVTPNTSAALKTALGTSGWWLAGIEVTAALTVTAQQYGLLFLGESGSPQNTLASVATDLVLDRMYIHGQVTTNMSRCVALNSARTQITDSYIVECHGRGFDSQAIAGWNGPGPYKIVNNTLQGAGENIIFGGTDPAIPNLIPSDIEIRRNYLYTPIAWKGVWQKKNLLELKNAARVLIEGNVLDGSWLDGQTGWAVILKSENQSGGCNWCRTTDVTFQRNLIQNVGAGISVAPVGPWAQVDSAPQRIVVRETVVDNVGVAPYTGDKRGFQLLSGTAHIMLERTVLTGNFNAALVLEGGSPASFRNNVWERGQYGVIGANKGPGSATVSYYAPGATWSNMIFVGTSNAAYPSGTTWVGSEGAAPLAAQIRGIVRNATMGVVIP